MKWRERIADWITGGELTFHQQTAVKALAEAQRERTDHVRTMRDMDKLLHRLIVGDRAAASTEMEQAGRLQDVTKSQPFNSGLLDEAAMRRVRPDGDWTK